MDNWRIPSVEIRDGVGSIVDVLGSGFFIELALFFKDGVQVWLIGLVWVYARILHLQAP